MDKLSYALGIGIGRQLAQMGASQLNIDDFAQAIKDVIAGGDLKVNDQEAQQLVSNFFAEQEAKQQAAAEEAGKAAKEEGEKFLAENAKKEGVKVLPSGVQYKVIKEGSGKIPADSSTVKVHYEGKLLDGTVFDSSYKRGQPAEMRCNQVIKGWTDALVHMPAGSIWEVYIPQELAYAERATGQIKPFSMLTFKIELLEVK